MFHPRDIFEAPKWPVLETSRQLCITCFSVIGQPASSWVRRIFRANPNTRQHQPPAAPDKTSMHPRHPLRKRKFRRHLFGMTTQAGGLCGFGETQRRAARAHMKTAAAVAGLASDVRQMRGRGGLVVTGFFSKTHSVAAQAFGVRLLVFGNERGERVGVQGFLPFAEDFVMTILASRAAHERV